MSLVKKKKYFVLDSLIVNTRTCANRASCDKGLSSFTDGLFHVLPYSILIFSHPIDGIGEELFKPGTETGTFHPEDRCVKIQERRCLTRPAEGETPQLGFYLYQPLSGKTKKHIVLKHENQINLYNR